MGEKTANVYARIEPEVKKQAEGILAILGIPVSSAINMFYKQIILQRGLPFEAKIPLEKPLEMSELSDEQLAKEVAKGTADFLEGRSKPLSQVKGEVLNAPKK
jgi:DNA-damage-inducible protein J